MWMAISGLSSDSAELLLSISPDLYTGPDGLHFLDLRKVHRYWSLSDGFEHLEAQWARLKLKAEFVLAPTAAQAAFLLNVSRQMAVFSLVDLRQVYAEVPIEQVILFEEPGRSAQERLSFWSLFAEDLSDLGLETVADLCFFPNRQALVQRWGKPLAELLRLALGETDWKLAPFELKPFFEARVNLALEKDFSAESETQLLSRLAQIFTEWDERLRLRRLRIGGVRLELRSYGKSTRVHLAFRMPRALVSVQNFLPMIEEKLQTLASENHSGPNDAVAEFYVQSMRLEPDFDVQMHLLEPQQESLDQSWAQAIGHMYSFAKQEGELRFGAYVPSASFLPESSLKWADGVMESSLPPFEDHPARPTLLLKKPELLERGPRSYENFVEWVSQKGLGSSLEKILNPWMKDAGLRIYTKYQEKWVFWSSRDERTYLHGFF